MMHYVITNGKRCVLVESAIHRDAYLSSGWWIPTAPKAESKSVVQTAEEVTPTNEQVETAVPKRRGGRPRKEG